MPEQLLVIKSNEYIKSANTLIEDKCWNSSVHCSYYACLQFIKAIIYSVKGRRNVDQDLKNKPDTHKYLIDNIMSSYAGKLAHNDELREELNHEFELNTSLRDLKAKREVADYTERFISEEESKDARDCAVKIIEILSRVYPN